MTSLMIQTYDVGSFPFVGEFEKFLKGVESVDPLLLLLYAEKYSSGRRYFEEKIVESFLDKAKGGIDIPNYPQFRDMNEMFLNSVNGIEKSKGGYTIVNSLSIKEKALHIPEVSVLEERAGEISEKIHSPLKVKVCVTGPYTLSSLFPRKDYKTFSELGQIVSQIVENNSFNNKFGRVELIAVDEPVFGLVDDPLLDHGSSGREELLKAWESIFHVIKSKSIRSCIHLHGTSNELFWQAKSLEIVESHVGDSLYSNERTKTFLEKEDKFLKASISVTDFDSLIKNHLKTSFKSLDEVALIQKVADTWTEIRKGKTDPTLFLESAEVMEERLRKIIRQFGLERIPYAGSECGLRSFPTYESAMECLRRVASAVRSMNKS